MTRKHYQAIAAALRAERPIRNDATPQLEQWRADVMAVANAINGVASNFDKARFLEACLKE